MCLPVCLYVCPQQIQTEVDQGSPGSEISTLDFSIFKDIKIERLETLLFVPLTILCDPHFRHNILNVHCKLSSQIRAIKTSLCRSSPSAASNKTHF